MYNASIHFELATFVARNTIYRYYTQQLVVVEWHCLLLLLVVVVQFCFLRFGCLYVYDVRTYLCDVVCYLCEFRPFLCSFLIYYVVLSRLFSLLVRKIHYCSLWSVRQPVRFVSCYTYLAR